MAMRIQISGPLGQKHLLDLDYDLDGLLSLDGMVSGAQTSAWSSILDLSATTSVAPQYLPRDQSADVTSAAGETPVAQDTPQAARNGAKENPGETGGVAAILLQFEFGAPESFRSAAIEAVGGTNFKVIRAENPADSTGPLIRVEISPNADLEASMGRAAASHGVKFVEPDWTVSIDAVSNDPGYADGSLWGMYGDQTPSLNIYGSQAGEAWAAGSTGKANTIIGVIDTGIDYTHPDLYLNVWLNQREIPLAVRSGLADVDSDALITFRDLNSSQNASYVSDRNGNGRIDAGDLLNDIRWENGVDEDGNGRRDDLIGWDFVNNDNDPFDDNGHGTHVSGTIGGIGGNGTGVAGVNWSVQIVGLKFLDGAGSGSTSGAIQAVDYFTDAASRASAAENFVATNNSWGGGGYSQALLDSISRGARQDILFIAAAGNSASNNDAAANYPSNYSTLASAGYEAVVAVASLTSTGGLSSFSSYGATTVDLAAPGSSIYSTLPGGTYGTYSGTSMATPHVAGAVALYASENPDASASQIRTALLSSTAATASLSGKVVTGGRLDISAMLAVSTPVDPPPPPPPPVDTIAGDLTTTATITASQTQQSVVDFSGDQDWFSVSLRVGYRYDFAMDAATNSGLDTYLRLMDSNGNQLTFNDDAVGLNSRLSFTASSSGTFYISAQGYQTSTGGYQISMSESVVNLTLVGSSANNTLLGGAGNDTLDGRAGADVMMGGAGNDTYFVDNTGDRVFETTTVSSLTDAGGVDTVFSSITLSLDSYAGIRFAENLLLTGSKTINGTGNVLDNVMKGNSAANILNGGAGNDILDGGSGSDTLIGGIGADTFWFDDSLSSRSNVDTITDFSVWDDTLALDNLIFTQLGSEGRLNSSYLRIGSSAADANDFIIYNSSLGTLSYDADGNGAGAAVRFAMISARLALSPDDFLIV